QHRGAYLIAVLPRIACDHERRWNRDYLCGGDRAIKSIVQAVQVPCVVLEIWHHMRIGDYQPGGYTGDAEGWQPVVSLGQLHRKRPDIFLVAKKVAWQALPRDLTRCRRGAAVSFR